MSRTYKHTKEAKLKRYYKARWETEHDKYVYQGTTYYLQELNDVVPEYVTRTMYLKKAGVLTKKKKVVDSEHHWMTTPSWWNNLFHTRPIRGKFRNFCLNAVKSGTDTLEEMLEPEDSKNPHKYFW